MPTAVFGPLQGYSSGWRLTLDEPVAIKQATTLEEVVSVIEFAENAALSGSYVALILSYEAAPAFDSALNAHPSSSFPLAWAATFADPSVESTQTDGVHACAEWTPLISRDEYTSAVQTIRELIAQGQTYQVNYSFPLTTSSSGDTLSWYRDLCNSQRAPYSAHLDLGRFKVLSLSPELFFSRSEDQVTTKPMKGTARRGRWYAEDLELKRQLSESAKDRAENVMIVDLLRNDLGKVSEPGSVSVASLFDVEKFETILQMTSTVESTLRPNTSLVDLIAALFPCGSITGAPKIRTTEIIKKLEPHPRGAYTGTIGFLLPGGDSIFNVAIRTVVVDSETGLATFGVGGGVTIDSTPELEYEECLIKSTFLRRPPRIFELFESILLENGEYFLLDQHLQRLQNSVDYFDFVYPEEWLRTTLNKRRDARPTGSWKVRLKLSRDGTLRTKVTEVTSSDEPKLVALASAPVDTSDRFLYHKTTSREFYESELAVRQDVSDVVFWNEQGEVTETTIANIVVNLDDKLVTPPIESGLLAGTFRDELIAEGKLEERRISVGELKSARQFFLINSVRKWMKAVLIE
jgi:para-aminobenzoate synthetase / 4-amino-4-deoxychorismate lyase